MGAIEAKDRWLSKSRADYRLRMNQHTPHESPTRGRPMLIVRLRNWVGDVTLSLPLLQRLHDAGYALQLLGKGWARELLAGHGWPVHTLPKTARERVKLLRRLRAEAVAQGQDAKVAQGRLNALCLPDSFSSALEFRLAGLRALGHAWEGRSMLLAKATPRERGVHEFLVYWQLGNALLSQQLAPPQNLGLKVAPAHQSQAKDLLAAHHVRPGYVVICPFAGGTWNQQDKTWPGFVELATQLQQTGRQVLVCPGPGEEAAAEQHFGHCTVLPGVNMGVYAALLQSAALMVSNDTGPGHVAAAVGTPLVSVLGPSDAALWRAWAPLVQVVQGEAASWPELGAVIKAVDAVLHPS
jgi:heptosyltransferase II